MVGDLGRRAVRLLLASVVALSGAGPVPGGAAAAGGWPVAGAAPDDPEPARPDIVVIYMDDFSPRVARLWSRPSRTPTLARLVDEGIELDATASTPLCCPARGNLLTGRYGHHSGVTRNDMRDFDPGATVAVQLQAAGYHTAFIGKFLNSFARWAPDAARVRASAQGWHDFDVIWENQGAFHDYRLWTREGVRRHGHGRRDHSSRVAGEQAVKRIRSLAPDTPLFLVVSLYDGHPPLTPMARFDGHPACRGIRPWRGPSYDEADVSDKPTYIRQRARLADRTYGLRQRCESILTVDWVAGQVWRALEETGRLDDTLIVFTADNGMLMGEHRLLSKGAPYSTPVPLYLHWPARWGGTPRSIDEPVQNVDLAPTFCRLAGCTLPAADGLDLLDLLDGRTDRLGRMFVYEELLHPGPRWPDRRAVPAWYGIRTTRAYSDRRWIYTEYETGERELYDLSADPNRLRNLAGDGTHAEVEAELRSMLHEGVVEPDEVRFRKATY